MSLVYRKMCESDLPEVLKNERQSYEYPWTEGVFRDCLKPRYEIWLAYYEGRLVGHGVISVVVGEGHLLNLCVAQHSQRKGFGAQLLGHLVDRVTNLGADVMFLEVRASNAAAIDLYEKNGFNLIGVRRNYYPARNQREDAQLMSLALNIDHCMQG